MGLAQAQRPRGERTGRDIHTPPTLDVQGWTPESMSEESVDTWS